MLKGVLFLTKSGLKKSYKVLIFISENRGHPGEEGGHITGMDTDACHFIDYKKLFYGPCPIISQICPIF